MTIPQNVLIREVDGESVLLSLDSGCYFGLDETGTSIWSALVATGSAEGAFDRLIEEYDVDPDLLRKDIQALVDQLAEHGLLEVEQP